MAYNTERGFGFKDLAVLGDRDRGAVTTNLLRDFVLRGSSFEFQLDVPNGTYAVKTYHGDWIGSTRTDVAVEGKGFGQVSSGKASSAEKIINPVLVTDGSSTSPSAAPASASTAWRSPRCWLVPPTSDTAAVDAAADPARRWNSPGTPIADAASYKVFRQATFEASRSLSPKTSREPVRGHHGLRRTDLQVPRRRASTAPASSRCRPTRVDVTLIGPRHCRPAAPCQGGRQAIEKTGSASNGRRSRARPPTRCTAPTSARRPLRRTSAAPPRSTFTDTTVLTTIKYFYRVDRREHGRANPQPSPVIGTDRVTS